MNNQYVTLCDRKIGIVVDGQQLYFIPWLNVWKSANEMLVADYLKILSSMEISD